MCMACKQGLRESMDTSRAYYQRLKEYDSFRALWVSLVKRSSDNMALDGWSNEEKTYFCVSLLEGEVYNGGFDQYFHNSSGDYYFLALDGLVEIEAMQSAHILREAASVLFGSGGPPDNQAERWQINNSTTRRLADLVARHHRSAKLEILDKRFCDNPDQIVDRLAAYAEEKGLVSPFMRDPSQ